jgi:hypothetical protein
MDASLMARFKELEAENRRLKKIYTEERIVRERLEPLAAPETINQRWSMDLMGTKTGGQTTDFRQ